MDYWNQLLEKMLDPMFIVVLIGQCVFGLRFIVQWIASEKTKTSVVPLSFWHLSIVGSLLILVYAFYDRSPALILGNLFNCPVYIRNLMLISAKQKAEPPISSASS